MRDKAVVVTGASTGIGEATSLLLAENGFRVFAGVRKAADGDRLSASSERVTPVLLDVTDGASIRDARETVLAATAEADLAALVNNAGIAVSGPLEFVPLDELRHQFEVNLFGQVAVTQAFLPALRRAKGRIVNMSSISGRLAVPFLGPYAMSKFALEAFSDALRREVHRFGVDVVCIEPGAIATPIWRKSLDASDAQRERVPAEAIELYGSGMETIRKGAERTGETAIPAETVARVVHEALAAARPRARYLVGWDARTRARLAWLLPDRWLDRIVRSRFR